MTAIARDMASIWAIPERLAFLSLELAYVKGERAGMREVGGMIDASFPSLRKRAPS